MLTLHISNIVLQRKGAEKRKNKGAEKETPRKGHLEII
jgi:hypothetical protein